jgi:hypothetical protein
MSLKSISSVWDAFWGVLWVSYLDPGTRDFDRRRRAEEPAAKTRGIGQVSSPY